LPTHFSSIRLAVQKWHETAGPDGVLGYWGGVWWREGGGLQQCAVALWIISRVSASHGTRKGRGGRYICRLLRADAELDLHMTLLRFIRLQHSVR
jgi:hypothetical protein